MTAYTTIENMIDYMRRNHKLINDSRIPVKYKRLAEETLRKMTYEARTRQEMLNLYLKAEAELEGAEEAEEITGEELEYLKYDLFLELHGKRRA